MYQFIIFTGCVEPLYLTKVLGAYKCANELRAAGYSCLVVDYVHKYSAEELEELLDKTVGPDTLAVGFSTTFFRGITKESFFPTGVEFEDRILDKIKSLNQNCKIMLGGHKVFLFEQNKKLDYILIGFSETSIVNLADHLYKQTVLKNSNRNLWGVTVIDDREAVNYNFKNSKFKWEEADVVNAKVLPLEVARGCVFRCKFCSFPMNGKTNLDLVRDSEILANELQDTYDRFGIDTYSIVDDTFNDDESKLDLMLAAVKKLSFQPKFVAYARLDLIRTPEQVEKLYNIGIRGLYFGLETLDQETGKLIGKGYSPTKQIEMLHYIRGKYGPNLNLHGSFMIGLPRESISSVRNTFKLIMDGEIPLHSAEFHAIRIDQTNEVAWTSDISKEYELFGYVESEDKTQRYINWRNDQMDFTQALALEDEFKHALRANKRIQLSAINIWSLLNFKIPMDYLINLPYADINWAAVELMYNKHLQTYKQDLHQLINAK